jgi:hypothetical protein
MTKMSNVGVIEEARNQKSFSPKIGDCTGIPESKTLVISRSSYVHPHRHAYLDLKIPQGIEFFVLYVAQREEDISDAESLRFFYSLFGIK